MVASFPPPFTALADVHAGLRERGYVVLAPASVGELCGCGLQALEAFRPDWDELPPDRYLKDGGNYRKRRHACFVIDHAELTRAPHRAHWQSEQYNALHGGMRRWFEPMLDATVVQPAWAQLLHALSRVCDALRGEQPWFVEAHQFRIDTADGIGRPTPEGAHRDGVDFVAVILVARHAIRGGETRVFDAAGAAGVRFTLREPWSAILIDDTRVIHESTPIVPTDEPRGHRDTLVLTFRAGGFQEPGDQATALDG